MASPRAKVGLCKVGSSKDLTLQPALLKELDALADSNPVRQPWSVQELELLRRYSGRCSSKTLHQIFTRAGFKRTLDSIAAKVQRST